ncbi:MAG: DMT family transporter [Chloroflexi bacterium]|nr:DMT family transporter [Chloroflexota bacterium]
MASVSAAAIFIRLADTEPLTFAAYRLSLGAALVAVPTLLRSRAGLRALRRADMPLLVLSGFFLAAHFVLWITSLGLTSVASSVLLVTTTPVFVALASHLWLRERVGRLTAAAVALTLAGGAVLAVGGDDERRLLGDGLALLAAVAVAGYLLAGRRARSRIANLPYVTVVYTITAAMLLVAAVATGAPMLGLPAETYFWIGLSALVPQAIGHTLLNWALAHASATSVSLAVRAEPVVATLLAIVILDEMPPWTVVPAAALVLAGVYLAIRAENKRERGVTGGPSSG